MTLEQIKEKAREIILNKPPAYTDKFFYAVREETLDEIIDSTHQATVEEIIKIVEAMPAFEFDGDGGVLVRLVDVIEAIKK